MESTNECMENGRTGQWSASAILTYDLVPGRCRLIWGMSRGAPKTPVNYTFDAGACRHGRSSEVLDSSANGTTLVRNKQDQLAIPSGATSYRSL